MDRREFVKDSLVMMGGAVLPTTLARANPDKPFKIEYIREKIPVFDVPPRRGAR